MYLNQNSLNGNRVQLERLTRKMESLTASAQSPIDRSFSRVRGVDEVGAIHERVIATDPGSAQNSLRGFARQLEWLTRTLSADAQGFEQQESANDRAISIADAGGYVGVETIPVLNQPEPGYSPFGFNMPIVDVGTDLKGLAFDLMATKIWDVSEANSRWKALSEEVQSIIDGLESAAESLESENNSDATAAAAQKIREVASSGEHFVSNAAVMREKLFTFHSKLMFAPTIAMALAGAAESIPDPVAKEVAKKAGLAKMQVQLQEDVVAAMPFQNALMEAAPASGGGSITAGLGGIDGDGSRYNTAGVAWPKAVAEALADGRLGPGSLQVVDGEISGLEQVGMSEAEIAKFHDSLRHSGRQMLTELGFGDALPAIDASHVATAGAQAAGASQMNLPGAGAASLTAGQPGTLGAAGMPVGAGLGVGAASSSNSVGAPLPVMSGASAGAGRGAMGVRGLGGLGAGAGVGGMSAGAGMNAGAGGGGIAAPPSGHVAGAGTRAGGVGSGAQGRGMAPVMAGHGRGAQEKSRRVKSVTSQVERDPNRRALLGESRAVVPGVIGDWVRNDPS
ncbi:hypothetical protein CFL01nite_16100 [Corynebacterium flavescens]|uniref:Uncharacterized protein n=3 Tax=Corynebacterium flavescens TaxID=28028 RepID=A0AB73B936_CORFL|nr:hypothetical protein CFL01nite_16100 [Corynebacterium flavescens]